MVKIWDILGINPTKDEKDIRRAYAKELKRRRPDSDPQGFQELREAFDEAKRYANLEVILNDDNTILNVLSEPTPMMAYVHQIMQEKNAQPKENWDRTALDERARDIAVLIIRDELQGIHTLRHYLDYEMSDSLQARQIFGLKLGEVLSEQKGLNFPILDKVSEIMDWQINNYQSPQLPAYLLSALEEQVAHTEQENYWQYLTKLYSGNRLEQFKWRLLTEKGIPIPWWSRLIPELLQQLIKQVNEIFDNHPDLQERLNPLLLDEYFNPGIGLSWNSIIAMIFWGYTAWLVGHESPKMALYSGLMVFTVFAFIWGYPVLSNRTETAGVINKCVHAFFWLASMGILAIAFYSAWTGASTWPKDAISIRIVVIALFIVVPVVGGLYQNLDNWRSLPTKIIVLILVFPIMFIRQLPPLINLLGLIFLPMLYGIFIEMIFFV